MATYQPPIRATEFIFAIALKSQATTQLQVNPTIAVGDFKVSTDFGAFGNLTTLPVVTPAGGRAVKVTLSAAEMTGDNIVFQAVDAAGAEWSDVLIDIQPVIGGLQAVLSASERNAIADAYLDRADAVETGLTPRGELRLTAAASAGVLSGAATTSVLIRNAVANTKTRITATVDSSGNRSAVGTDVT